MPANLNSLKSGWLELESDPGLFTLLLEDFGVKGVQVEEIYDLQKAIESPVFGFIFLFKWIEERRSRRKIIVNDEQFVKEEPVVNSIFFAHQIVPNSCATHALLSVLLNCEKIYLGATLSRLKEYTRDMSPENKGYAIGNTPELARAHNSHAKPEPRRMKEKPFLITTGRIIEAFHFVSYVPINGHLFELDGLKPYPIDHGPWNKNEDWTEKFRCLISDRIGIATSGEPYHDIRFNLMAVVPDRRIAYENKLRTLKINRQIVLEALQQLVKVTNPNLTSVIRPGAKTKFQLDNKSKPTASAAVSCSASLVTNTSAVNPPTSTVTTANNTISEDILVSTSLKCSSINNNSSSAGSIQSNCSTPTKKSRQARGGTSSPYILQHPALVPHNYAKSPLLEGHSTDQESSKLRYEQYSGSDYSSSVEDGAVEDDDDDDDEDDEDDDDDDDGDDDNDNDDGGVSDDGLSDFDEDDIDNNGVDVGENSDEENAVELSAPGNDYLFPPPKLIHSGPGSGFPLALNTTSPIPIRPISAGNKDFSKPLSIQTKFETSPPPSCSSTDTSSEVGSAFNSPVRSIHFGSAQNSPNFGGFRDFRRLVVIRVGSSATKDASEDSPSDANSGLRAAREQTLRCIDPPPTFYQEASSTLAPSSSSSTSTTANALSQRPVGDINNEAVSSKKPKLDEYDPGELPQSPVGQEVTSSTTDAPATSLMPLPSCSSSAPFSPGGDASRFPHLIEPHKFAPKDLLALLKNIENEITTCESTLKDEIDKQKKYKVDDSRRTHNYDSFICTFLSMLDCHGLLTDLVEQHISVKRRQGINLGRLHKVKKVDTRKRRPKPRKRK